MKGKTAGLNCRIKSWKKYAVYAVEICWRKSMIVGLSIGERFWDGISGSVLWENAEELGWTKAVWGYWQGE